MKNNYLGLFSIILFSFSFLDSYSVASIKISKGQGVPDDVCNLTEYSYVAVVDGIPADSAYSVSWIVTNFKTVNGTATGASIKWEASNSANGNIGTLKAKLKYGKDKNGNDKYFYSETISATIKSIKHIKAQIPTFQNMTNYDIDPCQSGTINLSAADIQVPGTGISPQEVSSWKWLVPSGWTVDGQTSNGSTIILGNQDVTVTYPASATEGSIKVQGQHIVTGCTTDVQESLASDPVSVKREINFTLSANKTHVLCGDTNPVTFTVSPAPSCAVYYWNNSQTPSTSNSFQVTPSGTSDVIATVTIVYGGKQVVKQKTIPNLLFAPGTYPEIIGNSTVCGGSATYSVSYLRPGYTVSYQKSQNLSISQTGNTCTLSMSGGGVGWLEATINTPCGSYPITLSKNIAFGLVDEDKIVSSRDGQAIGAWAQYHILCNSGYTTTVTDYDSYPDGEPLGDSGDALYQSITAYEWSFPSGWSYSDTYEGIPNQKIQVSPDWGANPQPGQMLQVGVRAQNDCGWTDWKYDYWQVISCSGYYLMVTPNPVDNEAIIDLQSSDNKASSNLQEWEVEVYDPTRGLKLKTPKLKTTNTKINVQDWKEGVYVVRAKIGKEVVSGKLIVKH